MPRDRSQQNKYYAFQYKKRHETLTIGVAMKVEIGGEIEYQWFGNAEEEWRGKYLPGWINNKTNEIVYKTKKPDGHRPLYLSDYDNLKLPDIHIKFTLDSNKQIPESIRDLFTFTTENNQEPDSSGSYYAFPYKTGKGKQSVGIGKKIKSRIYQWYGNNRETPGGKQLPYWKKIKNQNGNEITYTYKYAEEKPEGYEPALVTDFIDPMPSPRIQFKLKDNRIPDNIKIKISEDDQFGWIWRSYKPYYYPFYDDKDNTVYIAKKVTTIDNKIYYLWFGNEENDPLGVQLPCWKLTRSGKYKYQKQKPSRHAEPVRVVDAVLFEELKFKLTCEDTIPEKIIELISKDTRFDWPLEPEVGNYYAFPNNNDSVRFAKAIKIDSKVRLHEYGNDAGDPTEPIWPYWYEHNNPVTHEYTNERNKHTRDKPYYVEETPKTLLKIDVDKKNGIISNKSLKKISKHPAFKWKLTSTRTYKDHVPKDNSNYKWYCGELKIMSENQKEIIRRILKKYVQTKDICNGAIEYTYFTGQFNKDKCDKIWLLYESDGTDTDATLNNEGTVLALAFTIENKKCDEKTCETDESYNSIYVDTICGGTHMKHLLALIIQDAVSRDKAYVYLSSLFDVIFYYRDQFGFKLSYTCVEDQELIEEIEKLKKIQPNPLKNIQGVWTKRDIYPKYYDKSKLYLCSPDVRKKREKNGLTYQDFMNYICEKHSLATSLKSDVPCKERWKVTVNGYYMTLCLEQYRQKKLAERRGSKRKVRRTTNV